MFRGQRAWFCRSVSQDLQGLWAAQGGVICNAREADFLFSCDASHPDTMRIYQSFDYMEDNATVFHAYYLSAIANADMKNTVPLGHYVLPPACLQKEIRKKIGNFIWEQNNHVMTEKPNEVKPSEIKNFRKDTELSRQSGKDIYISTKKHISRTPVTGKQLYYPLQNYPVNNMVTGYVSIDTMKKFLGELHDFIPGSSGYLAYHVQKEINLFSAVKNKLKKKC
ncbi:telomere repeats-binding bouquet formation protein 2 [Sarcophilus harrisii]|uniref:Telomere repeat binding bouquet formation protein 2 n=1 Tax=Sarcophilus harrisii TaxID=9305 RepID=A0A7N4PZE2_SARHA|nr:telomere repeats-binding bouquet formation protein 2 [Sarcophilus harrisii]